MDFKPGDVVILKSGGHPVTVAHLHGETATCIWMGEEGDLFQEILPLAVLEPAERAELDEEEDEQDDEDGDEAEETAAHDKVA